MMIKKSLENQFLINSFIISIVSILLLSYIWLDSETDFYTQKLNLSIKDSIQERKDRLNFDIAVLRDQLFFNKNKAKKRIRNDLIKKVEKAYDTVNNIYNDNKEKIDRKTLEEIMISVAGAQSEKKKGRAYLFINEYDTEKAILGNRFNKIPVHISRDIEEFAKEIRKKGSAFGEYNWFRPGTDDDTFYKKISYGMYFKPYNWIIGAGDYLYDINKEVKTETIELFSNLSLEDDFFLLILDNHRIPLLLKDNNKVIKKPLINIPDSVLKQSSDTDKTVFFNLDKDFRPSDYSLLARNSTKDYGWEIFLGNSGNDLKKSIQNEKEFYEKQLKASQMKIIFVSSFLILISFLLTKYYSGKTHRILNIFSEFFKKASQDLVQIDTGKIEYEELKKIAISANQMVKERADIESKLLNYREHLEVLVQNRTDQLERLNQDLLTEIDQRNKADKLRIESESNFQLLSESSLLGIMISDKNRIFFINNALAKDLETSVDYFTDSSVEEFFAYVHPQDQAGYRQNYYSAINKPIDSSRFSFKMTTKNGNIIWLEQICRKIKFKGQEVLLSLLVNISKQKQVEANLLEAKTRAEKANHLKAEFLANMSHEIRTPMTSIMGFANLLKKTDLDEKQKNFVERIISSSNNLLLLINDIIDLSRIESGQFDIVRSRIDLRDLLDELEITYINEIDAASPYVNITINRPSPGEIILHSDPVRIKQVISNIFSNALKFTEEGKITVNYKVKDTMLELTIEDTGIGIPKDKQELIFDKFTQIDSSFTRKFGGTGLGLTIVKKLITYLDADITIDSEPSKGTKVLLTFPIKEINKKSDEDKENATALKNNEYTLLIVDDSDEVLMLLKEFFVDEGYNVITTKSGKESIGIFKKNKQISLVILDIRMPEIDRFSYLKQIREINEKIPVIALTAKRSSHERKEIFDKGFDQYISKPINIDFLLESIKRLLNKKQDSINFKNNIT